MRRIMVMTVVGQSRRGGGSGHGGKGEGDEFLHDELPQSLVFWSRTPSPRARAAVLKSG
jgi:hypothetical protein